MKANVNEDTCIGCGLCADTCPEVFVMENSIAKVKVPEVPPEYGDCCREAADECPVEAISID
ncbi:MAG: ferredoxin [Lentisphaerae bacterium GWF2_45_14]|nr:MAG: ferredoxin [Lentisphaerae bacterium GWF2_45_14]